MLSGLRRLSYVVRFEVFWLLCSHQYSLLTATFQAIRALMIVSIVLSLIGSMVSILALKCIRLGTMEDTAKANLTLTSGILFIVAGRVQPDLLGSWGSTR